MKRDTLTRAKPKIAFWFRYGPAEHAELFHAVPMIVERLAASCEVHYFGPHSKKPLPVEIQEHAILHAVPWEVDRSSNLDKWIKTVLWLLWFPWIGVRTRLLGIRLVYIDETVPVTAWLARFFFRGDVAQTVADDFVAIYLSRPRMRWLGSAIGWIDRIAQRRLSLIFTRSKRARRHLIEQGMAASLVHAVYDPCDFSIFHKDDSVVARKQFGLELRHCILVNHGVLHPNKGNSRILEALSDLRDRYPEFRYLLVGDGPERTRLENLSQRLRLEDHVIFTGWLPDLQDVNMALNAADIGLVMRVGQPSDHFHITGSLVHGMACGLAILAARLDGIAEVVQEGENGLLFDPDDMEEFREKLGILLEDRSLRERLGSAAEQRSRELFDMKQVTELTVAPLLRLLETNRLG